MSDHTVSWMKAKGVPLTRKNWLELNYLGNPPAELGPELEAEIPMDELIDEPSNVIPINRRRTLK